MSHPAPPDTAAIIASLRRLGLVGPAEEPVLAPLTGGVASDIFRVEAERGAFVVKRALAKLRVAADWRAPVERNAYEVEWLRIAGRVAPGAAPSILGHDAESGLFAMALLPATTHPVWKAELLAGRVDPDFAAAVGDRIGSIHAATAGDEAMARAFDTLHIFRPIRLEAYLEATARRHPGVGDALVGLSRATAGRRIALVHGDVSPKNILAGPDGPVFLDAECAWYGDPAFDLAFCLNHLLLKSVAVPQAGAALDTAFAALAAAYLARVDWEAPSALEARAAALLPGLLLARIDGKSPVEYITAEPDKERVRRVALPLLATPPGRLGAVGEAWRKAREE